MRGNYYAAETVVFRHSVALAFCLRRIYLTNFYLSKSSSKLNPIFGFLLPDLKGSQVQETLLFS